MLTICSANFRSIRNQANALLALFLACLVMTGTAHAQQAAGTQFIIKLKNSVELGATPSVRRLEKDGESLSAVMTRNRVDATWVRAGTVGTHVMRFGPSVRPSDVQSLLNRLSSDPDVDLVMQDRPVRIQATPNESTYTNQWHLQSTSGRGGAKFNLAWDLIKGSSNVVIAVLDTGVVFETPDLAGRLLSGYDFVSDVNTANDGDGRDANPADPGNWITSAESQSGPFAGCSVKDSSWHGTFVAGEIAANTNNSADIAGADWNVKILPVRVLGKCGGYLSDVLDAMLWSAGLDVPGVPRNTNPAAVINLSLGSANTCSSLEQDVVNRVTAAGTLVVAAAGNGGGVVDSPANCSGVMGVGAIDRDGSRAYYSALGTGVALMAPGGYYYGLVGLGNSGTTTPGASTLVSKTGTSFAAPLVAATAGLIKAVNSALTPTQIASAITSTTAPFLSPSGQTCSANSGFATCNCTTAVCGTGMLDAYAAVNSIRGTKPLANASVTANGLGTSSYNGTAPQESASASNPVLLRGSSSTALSGRTIASYLWEQVSGTPVLTGTRSTADVDLPAANSTSDLVFKLTVTDSVGESRSTFTAVRVVASGDSSSAPASMGSTTPQSTGSTTPVSSGGGGGGGGGGLGLSGLLMLASAMMLYRRRPIQAKTGTRAT
ncbi:S8 family peptidase [Limnobacter humi]|uniref:S8 family peptidase n=1 Tax=Limnobacter humi TaxID=1778671 RepID=A0ABT1WK33_9BURK|nr:S8 family serine peptidase [Limnobacter humi]MCQ8896814.1 S8 family peptidase [Limnobacter humi]